MQKLIAFLLIVCAAVFSFGRPSHAVSVEYQLPIRASVAKPFNAPGNPYAAGNRGIDFSVRRGQSVIAAAPGTVTFAGRIGSEQFVSIQHRDGIRTTYSYLATIKVRRGAFVQSGTIVGTTSSRFQWGAKIGEAYVDPAYLLDSQPARVYLVKDDPQLAARKIHTSKLSDWVLSWLRKNDEQSCTEDSNQRPPKLAERHIAVMVGGLGSSTGGSSLFRNDYRDFGYAANDIKQFSYKGGDARSNPYKPEDTTQDLRVVSQRLSTYLHELRRQNPGVPIDIYAHSLGGLVVRDALAKSESNDLGLAQVITIDSPHQGADLAIATRLISDLEGRTDTYPGLKQLDPESPFIKKLQTAKIPNGVSILSIGADIDPVVTNNRTWWNGATNVVVRPQVKGNPHSTVVNDSTTRREIGLALNGMAPSCATVRRTLDSLAKGRAISGAERRLAEILR